VQEECYCNVQTIYLTDSLQKQCNSKCMHFSKYALWTCCNFLLPQPYYITYAMELRLPTTCFSALQKLISHRVCGSVCQKLIPERQSTNSSVYYVKIRLNYQIHKLIFNVYSHQNFIILQIYITISVFHLLCTDLLYYYILSHQFYTILSCNGTLPVTV
jgi:hypothetical protein